MARNMNAKGRQKNPPGLWLQHRILDSRNYAALSSKAVKLLVDIGTQYRGKNNGDLTATWELMKLRGWKSKATLSDARDELIHYGFLILTRQGGRMKPNLYALSWQPIDYCKGKLDVPSTTVPSNDWMAEVAAFVPKRKRPVPRQSGQLGCMVGASNDEISKILPA